MPKLVIDFDNERARYHFVSWLCGSGEQHYWDWMDIRESEESGPITATKFDYHTGGDFNSEYVKAECGRLSEDFNDEEENEDG